MSSRIPDDFDQSIPPPSAPLDNQRRRLTLTDKLAAAVLKMTVCVDTDLGLVVPVIDPDWARSRTAKEIVTAFERWRDWDHGIALGLGGSNHPANLSPLPRLEHQTVKTPADRTRIAKVSRLTAAQEAMRAKLMTKAGRPARVQTPKKAAPLPGTKASGWRHRMDGVWERRPKP